MSTNGFREDELVTRKVKVGNEWQTRTFPVVGGRLRLAHEENGNLNLQTELVSWNGDYAVFKCTATTQKGQFIGFGTANNQRDARLAESLIELAETRSIARALRFAGFGMEFCGAEEVSHVAEVDLDPPRNGEPAVVTSKGNGDDPANTGVQSCTTVNAESNPKMSGNGKATQAQCRALYALSKRIQLSDDEKRSLLAGLDAATFEDLSREHASRLISQFQSQTYAS